MSDTSDSVPTFGRSLETENSELVRTQESTIEVNDLTIQDNSSTSEMSKSNASGLIESKSPKIVGSPDMTDRQSPAKKQEEARGGSIRKDVNYAIIFLDIVIFVSVSALVLWGFIDPTIYEGSQSMASPIIVTFVWIPLFLFPSGRSAWRRWKMRQDPYQRRSTGVSYDVDSSGGGGFYNL